MYLQSLTLNMNNLNKRQFGNFPTRIAFDKKISNYLNINLFIKKEFEADIFGSGNKVRKINLYAEYLKKQRLRTLLPMGTCNPIIVWLYQTTSFLKDILSI